MARSFYGVDVGERDDTQADLTAEIMDVFETLRPQASATPLIRIGGDIDGAYLVPDDLEGAVACFSPGVNRIKYFEDYLTDRYGITSHMVDFTCDLDDFTTPLKVGKQTFLKKWLDVSPGEDNISLEDWIGANDVDGDLLLQMDIEGAEYRNILATSDETLARFRVVVLEVHGLGKMLDGPVLRGAIAPLFEKLSRTFACVHAHPNNCCGDFPVPDTDVRIPHVLELTLVRNDRFAPAPGAAALPHPLDVSRNVPRNRPLFLSEAWCGGERPVESRVKMLEDRLEYKETVGASAGDSELAGVLSMTMQSLHTVTRTATPQQLSGDAVEVAGGRPYRLSSAYGASSRTGTVQPGGNYFFHTDFGSNQSIQVDLGRVRRVRRIEVANRRDGYQDRARYIFAELTSGHGSGEADVFPMFATGELPGGAWSECGIDLPDVQARYVSITTPVSTALHFSDLRIYATSDGASPRATAVSPAATVTSLARQVARRAPGRVKAAGRRAARRAPQPVKAAGRRLLGGVRPDPTPDGQGPSASVSTGSSISTKTSGNTGAAAGQPASTGKRGMYVLDTCAMFEVPVSGLIHVGANRADEYSTYHQHTHGPLLYIEALPELAERARRRLDPTRPHYLREAVVSDIAGENVTFHVASNDGGSSSMFEPGRHAEVFPGITFDTKLELVTERLDDIVAERPESAAYNVLVLDVQGAERKVLSGARKSLQNVDAVFTEVSSEPLYDGGCTFLEVTNLLADAGFVFRAAEMNENSWGDAFYSRPRTALHGMLSRNLAHGKPTRQSSSYGAAGDSVLIGDVVPNNFGVHTATDDTHPWWEVDLGETTAISRILYLDRVKHMKRAASLQISTSPDGERYDVVYRRQGKPLGPLIDIGASVEARYVRVSLEDGGPLHFRQLIVV